MTLRYTTNREIVKMQQHCHTYKTEHYFSRSVPLELNRHIIYETVLLGKIMTWFFRRFLSLRAAQSFDSQLFLQLVLIFYKNAFDRDLNHTLINFPYAPCLHLKMKNLNWKWQRFVTFLQRDVISPFFPVMDEDF